MPSWCISGEGLSRWQSLPVSFLFQLQRWVEKQVAPYLPSTTSTYFSCGTWPRVIKWCKPYYTWASNPMSSTRNTWEISGKKKRYFERRELYHNLGNTLWEKYYLTRVTKFFRISLNWWVWFLFFFPTEVGGDKLPYLNYGRY